MEPGAALSLGLRFGRSLWLLAAALTAVAAANSVSADVVLLDEYWTAEVVVNDVVVTEIDTQETGDPTEAKEGEFSALLENFSGWPSVRFRGGAHVLLSQVRPGETEATLWYRTDAWEGTWRLEIWVHSNETGPGPLKVLEGLLDGGGEDGRLIADDEWHQARGLLLEAESYEKVRKNVLVPTYPWLVPVDGWDTPHRTYVDRLEIRVETGPLEGEPAPAPVRHVRPDPGAQTTGDGWVWWEAEDAVEHNFPPGGVFRRDTVEQQEKLSNGAWLQHPDGGRKATWEVELDEAGKYALWCRGFWFAAPFRWRWNEGKWRTCPAEIMRADWVVVRQVWLTNSWAHLGDVDLPAGANTLEVEVPPPGQSIALDCWLLTREPFTPSGPNKPGEDPTDEEPEGRPTARTGDRGGARVGAAESAQAIEESEMPANVKREDGKVWIEGLEEMDWGGSFFTRQDSQVACLTEVLRCAGQDVTYADVMGLSGCAFKLTMAPNLFVAEIHSEMGMDWQEVVQRVFGLRYEFTAISFDDEENPDWREELLAACRESIDRGLPLFYMNGEWNLIVGYREDGSAFICKAYAGDDPGYQESATPTGFVGEAWFASTFERAGEPADRWESVVRSLQTAVELARRPAEEDGNRLYGFAAYEGWLSAVEEDRDDVSLHGNAFSYSQLLTSREAAAEYLRGIAEQSGGQAAEHLHAAADRYRSIFERMWDGQDCVAWPWDENWTPENRAIEAQIMRDNLADERAAIAQIEKALAAVGK